MNKEMGGWESVGRGLVSTILGDGILVKMKSEAGKREDYEGKFSIEVNSVEYLKHGGSCSYGGL